MNPVIKHKAALALLATGLSLLSVQEAQAASAFASHATLTYTLGSITNLNPDHPNDLTGLQIFGSFEQANPPDSYIATTGDGTITANNPSVSIPVSLASGFSHSFEIIGGVNDGTADTSQLGWFGLDFNNTSDTSTSSADTYSVEVTLGYQLHAETSGEYANNNVYLDYFNTDSSFAGSDFISASVFALVNVTQLGSSGVYSFNLGPGASQSLYADATITGNLKSSPVPLPAAFWLFLSGISGLFAFGKSRKG